MLERRGRDQYGQCLAEGVRLVEDAIGAGINPALVFYVADAVANPRVPVLLDRAGAAGVPICELAPAVFATLSDTVTSQGLIAVLPVPHPTPPPRPTLALLLDRVRDPGNLGTTLRSAEAAGADLVLLTRGCTDAYGPKVVRAGMGAHFRLPLVSNASWEAAYQHLTGCAVWLADARGRCAYDAIDWTVPSAVILSSETEGLAAEAVGISRGRVAIPMAGAAESLNVAMAATILLFEAGRQRRHRAGER